MDSKQNEFLTSKVIRAVGNVIIEDSGIDAGSLVNFWIEVCLRCKRGSNKSFNHHLSHVGINWCKVLTVLAYDTYVVIIVLILSAHCVIKSRTP